MATSGQNFAIYDLDQFQLRFNVTDAVGSLNSSEAEGWWGVSDTVTDTTINMQKSTNGWSAGGSTQVPNFAGMTINANSIDCFAVLNSNGNYDGTIELQPTWGTGETSVDYYHELVYDDGGEQEGSTVIATGTLTVYRSAFTQKNFRK